MHTTLSQNVDLVEDCFVFSTPGISSLELENYQGNSRRPCVRFMYEVLTSRGSPFAIVKNFSVCKSSALIMRVTGLKSSNFVLIYGVIMVFNTVL